MDMRTGYRPSAAGRNTLDIMNAPSSVGIDTFFSTQSVLRTLAVRFQEPLPLGAYPLPEEEPPST